MADQTKLWEYRVQTVGNSFTGARDDEIEETLNEWGLEGWEAVNVYAPSQSPKITLVAKRALDPNTRRLRSMP